VQLFLVSLFTIVQIFDCKFLIKFSAQILAVKSHRYFVIERDVWLVENVISAIMLIIFEAFFGAPTPT